MFHASIRGPSGTIPNGPPFSALARQPIRRMQYVGYADFEPTPKAARVGHQRFWQNDILLLHRAVSEIPERPGATALQKAIARPFRQLDRETHGGERSTDSPIGVDGRTAKEV